jgi:exosortase A
MTAALQTETAAAPARAWRRALPVLAGGVLLWALLFHAEIAAAVGVWIDSTAYNHGFFVLPIALWLAWDRRGRLRGAAPAPTLSPALAALPLALAWFAADRLGVMEGRQFAALFLLWALLVGGIGWRLARAFAAPLLYLVFLVPSGAFLVPVLQRFTAHFIDIGLDLLGIPHVVTEFIIEIPEGRFFVAEACAGLRFLIAAVAFGALYALLIYRSPGRRIAFLLVAAIVPVIANGLRALGIVVLGHVLGSAEAAVADHLIYGWGFFSAVILLLTLAGLPFREDAGPPAAKSYAGGGVPATPWLAVAAVLLPAALGVAAAGRLDRSGPAPALALPEFVPGPACAALPPAEGAQLFTCAGATLTARVQALPAGAGVAAVQAAVAAATGERGAEDVMRTTLSVPALAIPWRLTALHEPPRLTATALFLDGAPAPAGLALRLRLARDGLGGRAGAPVLVSAALAAPALADPAVAAAGQQVLAGFLAAQTALLTAAAQASGPSPGVP